MGGNIKRSGENTEISRCARKEVHVCLLLSQYLCVLCMVRLGSYLREY